MNEINKEKEGKKEIKEKYEVRKNIEINTIEEKKDELENFFKTEKMEEMVEIEIYEMIEPGKKEKNKDDSILEESKKDSKEEKTEDDSKLKGFNKDLKEEKNNVEESKKDSEVEKDKNKIITEPVPKGEPCCKIMVEKALSEIIDIKLNPKYHNILMVLTKENILFYCIDTEIITINKPRFIFNKENNIFKSAIFNPYKGHIITSSSTCYENIILIWSIGKPSIKEIICKNPPSIMKWEKKGYLLGFIDSYCLMKIYSILQNNEIFYLDFKEIISDFNFFGYNNILIGNKSKDKIYQYKFNFNLEENLKIFNKNECKYIYSEKYKFFYVSNSYILIYSDYEKRIKLFNGDLENDNLINEFECELNDSKIIKNSDETTILISDVDKNNRIKLNYLEDNYKENKKNEINKDILEDKNNDEENNYKTLYDSFNDSTEEISKEYFDKNCPEKFCEIKNCLNFENNIYQDEFKKNKEYFKIEEITKILKEEVEKENLIQRRKYVKEEIKKIKIFNTIKEEYMFYLKLLIRDETNVDLLNKYLSFLQKGENEEYLEKEGMPHEKFYDELKYYSIFFEKEEKKKISDMNLNQKKLNY